VDLVGCTCDLQEAAVFFSFCTGKAGCKLQRVLNLSAGDRHQTGHIAKGADLLAGLEGPVARRLIRADAAAVHDGDITVQLLDLIEVDIDTVRHKVTEVGLAGADAPLAGSGIADVEVGFCHCDLLTQHIIHRIHPCRLNACNGAVGTLVGRDQLRGNGAIGLDGHFTDIGKVGAGLRQSDRLAGQVFYPLTFHNRMGMPVNKGVKAGGMFDHFPARPRRGRRIYAQMAKTNDVIGKRLCPINGILHRTIQFFAVVTAQNIIDIEALARIHKVSRGGFGEGLRRRHTDKGDGSAANAEIFGVRQNTGAQRLIDPVAGEVRIIRFLHHLACALHAIVKFMVARGGNIVARGIHQLDNGFALIHRAISGALNMVACVHQQDIFALVLIALFQRGNGSVGQLRALLVDVGMDIVGVQDGDVLNAAEACRCSRRAQTDGGSCGCDTCCLEKAAAGDKLFHGKTTSSCFCRAHSSARYLLR